MGMTIAIMPTGQVRTELAIYTAVTDQDVSRSLLQYDIGELQSLKGIVDGVQNSNYFLSTSGGFFILTLYEQMVKETNLPFYLDLMEYLAGSGVNCPQPVKMKNGETFSRLCGRPAAIVSFLDGVSLSGPLEKHCRQVGRALAGMHLIARNFPLFLENSLSNAKWRDFYGKSKDRTGEILEELPDIIEKELAYLEDNWPTQLPGGIIHADLFPDNILFLDDRISGLIDFYFSANDLLAFDIAICINAWCFDGGKKFNRQKSKALLEGYQSVRKLESAEIEALPILCRGASMRFLITRIYDWLNVPSGALVTPHDPLIYLDYLKSHQTVNNFEEYGIRLNQEQ